MTFWTPSHGITIASLVLKWWHLWPFIPMNKFGWWFLCFGRQQRNQSCFTVFAPDQAMVSTFKNDNSTEMMTISNRTEQFRHLIFTSENISRGPGSICPNDKPSIEWDPPSVDIPASVRPGSADRPKTTNNRNEKVMQFTSVFFSVQCQIIFMDPTLVAWKGKASEVLGL